MSFEDEDSASSGVDVEFSCFNIVSYNNLSNTDWLCRAAVRIAMVRTKFEELKKKMSKEKRKDSVSRRNLLHKTHKT